MRSRMLIDHELQKMIGVYFCDVQPACSQPALYPSLYLSESGAGGYGNPSIHNFSPRKQPSVQSLSWLLSSQKTFVVDARSSSVDVAAAGDIDGVAATAREQTTMAINRLLAFTLMTLSY